MKNNKAFAAVFLVLMLMTGCSLKSFDADTNTVYLKNDGKVMQALIEEFSESHYDSKELEELINQDISEYNDGEENVKVETYKVKDNTAKLITSYKRAADYAKFNEVEFFAGTINDAKAQGYDFDSAFVSTEDKNTVGAETIMSLSQYKVIIFEENVQVKIDSKILYSSNNLKLVDDKIASLPEDAEGFGYIIYE